MRYYKNKDTKLNRVSNGYVQNLHVENKETLKELIQTQKNEAEHLKSEIEFLRAMIKTENPQVVCFQQTKLD